MNFATLPMIAVRHSLNLDRMRRMVRTDPDLSRLGQRIGLTKAFTEDEVAVIVQKCGAAQPIAA